MGSKDLVTINFYASARAAARIDKLELRPSTFNEILLKLSENNDQLRKVLPQCTFLLNGVAVTDFTQYVYEQSSIDVLPKFAGG